MTQTMSLVPIVVSSDHLTVNFYSELTEQLRDPAVFNHVSFIDLNCTSGNDWIFAQIAVRIFFENELKQVMVVALRKVSFCSFSIQHDALHIWKRKNSVTMKRVLLINCHCQKVMLKNKIECQLKKESYERVYKKNSKIRRELKI